uniref:Auxin-responsive protein n=1 Tax=Kalanchoe fedtschenkoi TaxID=63787 RepID=A0A7N0UI00_KALFE
MSRMTGASAVLDASPSSSTDSSGGGIFSSLQHSIHANPSLAQYRRRKNDTSSDLKLGLSISLPSAGNINHHFSSSTDNPTKPTNRKRDEIMDGRSGQHSFLFVKVFMEGVPVGRKLDLYAHCGYDDLLAALSDMFGTSVYSFKDVDGCRAHSTSYNVLTYEDRDGDWMMVGDVPWELFLTTVRRLKITRSYSSLQKS